MDILLVVVLLLFLCSSPLFFFFFVDATFYFWQIYGEYFMLFYSRENAINTIFYVEKERRLRCEGKGRNESKGKKSDPFFKDYCLSKCYILMRNYTLTCTFPSFFRPCFLAWVNPRRWTENTWVFFINKNVKFWNLRVFFWEEKISLFVR